MINKWVTFIVIHLVFFACNHTPKVVEKDCNMANPDTVLYSKNIQTLFTANCSLSGCHSGSSPQGGLNLETGLSYPELLKKGSGYVDTLNPERSVLYSSLVSTTQPMPPMGNLDKCDIELIKKWMLQKAKNN
jgi:hypothetical protein